MQPTKPELKAILVCDSVIADKLTDKYTLIGIFDRIYLVKFPTAYSPVCLYVAFTGALGDYSIRIEFYDRGEDKRLANIPLPRGIHSSDRLKVNQVVCQFPPLQFPHEGNYEIRVYANDEMLGQKIIQAVLRR